MKCRICGTRMESGRCEWCFTKDVKASCPAVSIPEGVEVESVHIAPLELEGRPYPQPLTLAQAIERGFLLEVREGWGRVFYLRSARVKLILKKEP